MEITQIICDECGAKKGETNHWIAVRRKNLSLQIHPFFARRKGDLHLCGHSCAISMASMFLHKLTDAPDADSET